MIRSPIKCPGGKAKLVPVLLSHFPKVWSGTYHEPFVGGGALFFALAEADFIQTAHLGDASPHVVSVFRAIKDRPEDLIGVLGNKRWFRYEEAAYYRRREEGPPDDLVGAAAWFMYLNRTCFNGLMRFNRKGECNTPFGRYDNPTICDAENIRCCALALERATIRHEDFGGVAKRARPNDLVYFDPPYVPVSKTSSFTAYTSDGFGIDEQRRLRDVAVELAGRGVHVMLSNSPAARGLYRGRGFRIHNVSAKRSVNAKGHGRGPVREILVTSY